MSNNLSTAGFCKRNKLLLISLTIAAVSASAWVLLSLKKDYELDVTIESAVFKTLAIVCANFFKSKENAFPPHFSKSLLHGLMNMTSTACQRYHCEKEHPAPNGHTTSPIANLTGHANGVNFTATLSCQKNPHIMDAQMGVSILTILSLLICAGLAVRSRSQRATAARTAANDEDGEKTEQYGTFSMQAK